MTVGRKALTDKLFVLGIDGLDPRLTRKYVDEGKMPNTKYLIEQGAAREDLVLLGGQPTITPPMWTTLATGAYPCTHGITCFTRQNKDDLSYIDYNLDSTNCEAEQIWNITAEAGKKTLVWGWPGSAWPPTSDSPNLFVVDGTTPSGVNTSNGNIDKEKILLADVKVEGVTFKEKAAQDSKIPCFIDDTNTGGEVYDLRKAVTSKSRSSIIVTKEDGEGAMSDQPFDVVLSGINTATGWINAPEDAKEFILLHSGGLIRRPCLILKNQEGKYDRVEIYKTKKETEPIASLKAGVFTANIYDEAIKDDVKYTVNRNMRILELSDDGEHLKMWISTGLDMDNDAFWHPKSLYREVVDHVGYPQPVCLTGGADKQLIVDCMGANWDYSGKWNADVLHYLVENEGFEVVFSQYHNVDLESHMIAKYLKNGHKELSGLDYQQLMENVYKETDQHVGRYLDLLDKGWTILLLSDHGIVCPEFEPPLLCDASGLSAGLMGELGYTVLKKDAEGRLLKEVDWGQTKAVQTRGNHIWINLKGRNKTGIVDESDKYELEEQIMTDLYGYKHPETGKRIIALALRNKDAVLLGMGGSECGDIMIWLAEGYNHDHGDSLSTTFGHAHTSVSPIFVGAGPGIKRGFYTGRIIREVDIAPTVSALLGVRMPAQCEGAPIYQILSEEF
jgi:Uncharacterized conserved protein